MGSSRPRPGARWAIASRAAARAGAFLALAVAGCHTEHVLGSYGMTGTGGAGGIVPACGAFMAGPNLAACTATYLSGRGAEAAAAVDVGADGAIAVATTAEATELGMTPREVIRGSAGAIARLSSDGRRVLSVWRVGDAIADMEIDPNRGTMVVLGSPFGVAAITPDGRRFWEAAVLGSRVAVGSDGTVAVLDVAAGNVHVFEWTGAMRATFSVAGVTAADVAVHGGSKTVVVTGSIASGTVRQPFLDGYTYDGARRWRGYGWGESEVMARSLTASTTGVRVAIGRDDRLYYAGESRGGNTTHSRSPRDLSQAVTLASYDEYTKAYDVGPASVLFVARFRPADGAFETGQMHLARLAGAEPATGQSVNPLALAADEKGNVLVGGTQRCCLPDQSQRAVAGTRIASAMPDADGFALLIPADFGRRLVWTTFSQGSPSRVVGVAIARGAAATVALQDATAAAKAALITTADAVQPQPAGGASDAHLVVWSAP